MPRNAAATIECVGCGAPFERGPRAKYCSDKCQRVHYQKNWYERNKGTYRDRYLKTTYNLTVQDFNELRMQQNDRCAICRTELSEFSDKNIHIDHCHASGRVRGVLCINCNTGLGSFFDNPLLLEAARRYLDNA